MNPFFAKELHRATVEEANAPWLGGRRGEHFRCAFCGAKLAAGDLFRVLYSNGTPGASGNPLVCALCNATDEELLERWKAMHELARTKFWWFTR